MAAIEKIEVNGETYDISPPGGYVKSFKGRQGAVTPQSGDYAVADITGLTEALEALETTAGEAKTDAETAAGAVEKAAGDALNSKTAAETAAAEAKKANEAAQAVKQAAERGDFKGEPGEDGKDGAPGKDGAKGPAGPAGTRGSQWFTGTELNTTGDQTQQLSTGSYLVGDYYLNSSTGQVYRCTVASGGSSTWTPQGSIKGATGAKGADGAPGKDGAQGPAGPNEVTVSTASGITGLLKGADGKVAQALAGTDYLSPSGKAAAAGTADKVAKQLSFTGASSVKYDGSSAQSVAIPTVRTWTVSVGAAAWVSGTDTWSGITAGYKAEVTASGMTEDTEIGCISFAGGDLTAAGQWRYLRPGAGKVTLYSEEKPGKDFSLILTEVK